MKRLTEEQIKQGMEGIYEEDLQRRLKDFYLNRMNMSKLKSNDPRISERQSILKENNDLCIKIYESVLSRVIVERARRSAGLYKTQEEIDSSIINEQEALAEEENKKDNEPEI